MILTPDGNVVSTEPGFDPKGVIGEKGGALLPRVAPELMAHIRTADEYLGALGAGLIDIAKAAGAAPPQAYSYAGVTYMPDASQAGLIPWPKYQPDMLRRISQEHMAVRFIIQSRLADIGRYAVHAAYPWRPGWRIELMEAGKSPTDGEKKDIQKAVSFISNCSTEYSYTEARERDAAKLSPFAQFLKGAVQDTMTYDGWSIWTDTSWTGKVKSFANLPAGHVRLAHPKYGYKGDPSKFAALVDETGNPVTAFTRDEMVWRIRNPRQDPLVFGYGWPEIEQGFTLSFAFQNAMELNSDTFDKNAIPVGMMLLKGDFWSSDQIDLLMRAWTNMKKGTSKGWGVPVLGVPTDGEVEIVKLNDLKGEDVRYKDHMNMTIGSYCIVYQFPVRRFGFFTSGHKRDSAPLPDESVEIAGVDDPGLPDLLYFIADTINQYLLWPNWPHLRFAFSNVEPKSDAREYEARKLARTWKESRAEADLPELSADAPAELKPVLDIMEYIPEDPNKAAVFGQLASVMFQAMMAPEGGEGEGEGGGGKPGGVKAAWVPGRGGGTRARMQSKTDPALAREHGHMSGVRRNSRAEKDRAEARGGGEK